MKKIAIVLNSAWQGYNFRINLARELKRKNYEVFFLAPEDFNYSEKLKKDFKFVHIGLDAKGINPISDLLAIYSLFKAFKMIKPEIVLNFTIKPNIYGSLVSGFLSIPVINNITGLGTVFIKPNVVSAIVKLLYKISFKKASFVFFQNFDDRNFFIREKLVSMDKTEVIPGSGVDTNFFNYVDSKKQNHNTFKFLMVSRLISDKGVYEFFEAAKLIKTNEIEFWFLGETNPKNLTAIPNYKINDLKRKGIISFYDRTDDVKSFLSKVDCVVLPSYREGSPRSIMEASSSGIPVIVTDVPGCRDVVDDKITGLYCKVKNPKDLANKMNVIYKMTREKRKLMGQMGRQKMVNFFDESIVLEKYKCKIFEITE